MFFSPVASYHPLVKLSNVHLVFFCRPTTSYIRHYTTVFFNRKRENMQQTVIHLYILLVVRTVSSSFLQSCLRCTVHAHHENPSCRCLFLFSYMIFLLYVLQTYNIFFSSPNLVFYDNTKSFCLFHIVRSYILYSLFLLSLTIFVWLPTMVPAKRSVQVLMTTPSLVVCVISVVLAVLLVVAVAVVVYQSRI